MSPKKLDEARYLHSDWADPEPMLRNVEELGSVAYSHDDTFSCF